ncbi:MAG: tetratricopeptide repeat protein [Gammaproteobacteria bacterium]|nr:tetratricopeptide repeat protein [Gammaproteobacteria bacterium]
MYFIKFITNSVIYAIITSVMYRNRLIFITSALFLSACSQENIKPADETTATDKTEQSRSISKASREKYRDGITALHNDDLSKAQRIFNEFIRNNPNLAGAYTNLALVHFKKKEYEKSLKQANKALELNPKQAQAHNLRAQLYVIDGKIHKAKDDYIKAIEVKPDYINAQYNLALLYDIYLQEISLAIKHYKIYMSLLKKPDETTKEWITHLQGTLKDG